MEIHSLAKIPRTGWLLAGVTNPETVTEHSFETAMIAYILSRDFKEAVDLKKVLLMALFHEIAEARITDLPRRSKDYIGKAKRAGEAAATADILLDYSPEITRLLEEMHEKKSAEARLVEAAEELQIVFKALVYAKENRGDMSEYRKDIDKYDDLGVAPARALLDAIKQRFHEYLGDKPYWPIGYSK
jgi:putative hydrolase of HD superfamily